jgi:hypothetical protein
MAARRLILPVQKGEIPKNAGTVLRVILGVTGVTMIIGNLLLFLTTKLMVQLGFLLSV